MNRAEKEKKLKLIREKRIRKAKQSLWEFCKLESPDFYNNANWHLQLNCWVLQALYERQLTKENFIDAAATICPDWFFQTESYLELIQGLEDGRTYTKLMQNLPPRIGKSRTLVNYCKWVFGQSVSNKVITTSYNDDMAQDFSRNLY